MIAMHNSTHSTLLAPLEHTCTTVFFSHQLREDCMPTCKTVNSYVTMPSQQWLESTDIPLFSGTVDTCIYSTAHTSTLSCFLPHKCIFSATSLEKIPYQHAKLWSPTSPELPLTFCYQSTWSSLPHPLTLPSHLPTSPWHACQCPSSPLVGHK